MPSKLQGELLAKPTHTAGPWFVRESKADRRRTFIASAKVESIAHCRKEEDAPLLAAAPELLDAAKLGSYGVRALLGQLPRGVSPALRTEFEAHLAVIDAAVAKAGAP